MVLTEAFAAATPVVASDIPGYREVVRDGIDGLLAPPGDPLALAESLRRLVLDARMRAADGARGPGAGRAVRLATRRRGSARLLRAGDRDGSALGARMPGCSRGRRAARAGAGRSAAAHSRSSGSPASGARCPPLPVARGRLGVLRRAAHRDEHRRRRRSRSLRPRARRGRPRCRLAARIEARPRCAPASG